MRYKTFLKKINTYDGVSVIIAGIYEENKIINSNIDNYIKQLKFSKHDNVYFVDFKLAFCINKYFQNTAIIAGGSVKIEGINVSTGGVLGSIDSVISSSDCDIEEIGKDFILFTKPEGPGIVAYVDDSTRNIIKKLFENYKQNCTTDVTKIKLDLDNYNVECYIIVTDGCNSKYNGLIITKDYKFTNAIYHD